MTTEGGRERTPAAPHDMIEGMRVKGEGVRSTVQAQSSSIKTSCKEERGGAGSEEQRTKKVDGF